MADFIKCLCSHCGAKYRLPQEFQGRTARCKKCGEKFEVPRAKTLEDSVLDWLSEADDAEEQVAEQPRVINIPKEQSDEDATRKAKGPIRIKAGSSTTEPH